MICSVELCRGKRGESGNVGYLLRRDKICKDMIRAIKRSYATSVEHAVKIIITSKMIMTYIDPSFVAFHASDSANAIEVQ